MLIWSQGRSGSWIFEGAKDIIFPSNCSFSKNFQQHSILLRISDRLGAREL